MDVRSTLYGFITLVLGVSLYDGRNGGPDWQGEIPWWFENPSIRTKATVVTPNGAGKTDKIVASLAVAYAARHARSTVVILSRDGTQLDSQVWPSIERMKPRFASKKWVWNYRYVESPTGARIIGRAVDDPGRAEGFHKLDNIDGPLLIIVDEAKSIPEPVFTALDRCTFNGLLYVSSPGLMMGRFYESHTRLAGQFRFRRRVSLTECPHIPKEKIDDIIASYGIDHPFTRSAVFGEFTNQDDASRFVFPLHELDACLKEPPAYVPGGRFAFCDFAAGGDENVMGLADGNRISLPATWKERDTASATGRFLNLFRDHQLPVENVWGDESGLGVPICDNMREHGFDIGRENNGAAPLDDRYKNRGAEIWHETAMMVRRREIIVPDDPVLHAQLTTRFATIDSRGRLGVESKEKLAKRGMSSPDRADAFCGVAMAGAGKMRRGAFFTILG